MDFANTVYRRTPELGADLFTNAVALTTWLDRTHLLPATDQPYGRFADPDAALDEARALRGLFWTVFDAHSDGRTIPADALSSLLATARRGIAGITVNPDGSMTTLASEGVFAILALRAIRLVLSPPSRGVHACDRCGWFFLDNSRGRRRRWCSMKTCGNQAKAERFRAAHP
nr:CGNR zinc finger domain-containing protein [Brachybacterium sacelli]